jgi:NAD(P)H dehydrogenase (quinone)
MYRAEADLIAVDDGPIAINGCKELEMITVTAATGRYGRLVIDALLSRGVPASEIVAAVRDPQRASDIAAKGVQVREADYDRPETLVPAFEGADKLLLVPSAVFGQRYPQMQRAVNAAVEAGVGLLLYASFVNTDTSTLRLGEEHKQTEALIRASGLPYVLLRNGAYTELYAGELGDLEYALMSGVMIGSAGEGKISGASRKDLAEAAAVVLTRDGQDGKVYELGGTAFTMADLAATIGRHVGKPMVYQDLSVDEYAKALAAGGVPEDFAWLLADTSFAITRGDWYTESTDLPRLLGRPRTPLAEVVAATLNSASQGDQG